MPLDQTVHGNATSSPHTITFATQPQAGTLIVVAIGWFDGTANTSGSVTDNGSTPNTYTLIAQVNVSTTESAGIWSASNILLPTGGVTKLAVKLTEAGGGGSWMSAWTFTSSALDTHNTNSGASPLTTAFTPTTGGTATLYGAMANTGGGISGTTITTGYVFGSSGTTTSSGTNNGDSFNGTGTLSSGANNVVLTEAGKSFAIAGIGVTASGTAAAPFIAYGYGPN